MPHQAETVLYGVYRRDGYAPNSVERSAHGLFGFIRAGSFFPFDPSSSCIYRFKQNRSRSEFALFAFVQDRYNRFHETHGPAHRSALH